MAVEFAYSIEDLPLDEWSGQDGDNSLLVDGPLQEPDFDERAFMDNEIRTLMGANRRGTIYVPFKRQLKRGMVGPDVKAVHRALRVASGEMPGTPTRLFGPAMKTRLVNFQKRNRLVADGVYGLNSHKKLAPHFDNYGSWLLGQTKLLSPEQLKRQKIAATAMHGYNNRYAIHYTQSSLRMSGVRNRLRPPAFGRYEDCSSFATWCYWVAGVSDPNGLGYNGWGYTGTLANHGHKISFPYAKPGDLVFYGRYPYSHVTIYIGGGRCVSHGSEIGPILLPYNYRTVNHIRSYF